MGPFDGFHSTPASVAKTCTVRFDNNKYSVLATAVGRPVDVHAYAERIVIRQAGVVVGDHARAFGRGQTVYDPWHYVPVLARKPGTLRNGAPFKDWVLPPAMAAIRRKLKGSDDGDRQMVEILAQVPDDGLQAVEASCREALDQGVHSAPVIINILAQRRDPSPSCHWPRTSISSTSPARRSTKVSWLNRSVAVYRLAFGQPRQDDLLALLDQVRDEIAPEALAQLQISLRPE